MDNFDKNQVDNDLLEKVDEILTGERKFEETPELVFSEEVPKDYDISEDLQVEETVGEAMHEAEEAGNAGFEPDLDIPDADFDYDAPAAPEVTWQSLRDQRGEPTGDGKQKATSKELNSKATIGFVIGVIAVAVSLFGMALGILPVAIGIVFSNAGRKGEKRKMAIAGLVLNIIGAVLWVLAVVRNFSL